MFYSVKNPPPICFGVPLVKNLKACLKLSDVSFKPHHHGACLAIELKVFVFHKTFNLGCIYKDINVAKQRRQTPLEILQAVRTLVNADRRELKGTGNEKLDWLRVSDESGNKEEQFDATKVEKVRMTPVDISSTNLYFNKR
jgi:hypothetical protein